MKLKKDVLAPSMAGGILNIFKTENLKMSRANKIPKRRRSSDKGMSPIWVQNSQKKETHKKQKSLTNIKAQLTQSQMQFTIDGSSIQESDEMHYVN